MDQTCRRLKQRILAIAEGQKDVEATAHVSGCDGCQALLLQYQRLLQGLRHPVADPPSDVLMAAIRVSTGYAPNEVTLIGSSLLTQGIRSAGVEEGFQLIYKTPFGNVRAQYMKEGKVWLVTCQLPDAQCFVARAGKRVPVSTDGFAEFAARTLKESSFIIGKGKVKITIPSPPDET